MRFCSKCGKEIHEDAKICVHCGCEVERKTSIDTSRNKWIALLLWLFLGGFGGHQFYTGNNSRGIWYIVGLTLGSFLIVPVFIVVILLIIDLIDILQGELNGVELEG